MIDYTLIKARPTRYRGIMFRSRLEATWAAFFDQLQWPWEYEPFELNGWLPDFVIKGETKDVLVEVKPTTTPDLDTLEKITRATGLSAHLAYCGSGFVDEYFAGERMPFASIHSCCMCESGARHELVVKDQPAYDWEAAEKIISKMVIPPEIKEELSKMKYTGQCVWMNRYIVKINGKFDIVFGHWPTYTGFRTGIEVTDGGDDPYVGDEVRELWARAKNATQWRPHGW
jgi:hypothetical protein